MLYKLIKKTCAIFGLEVKKIRKNRGQAAPGSSKRPMGDIDLFLEDIKARGFIPRGIIDVGANRGEWTRLALSVFPSTQVIMIEPQDEMASDLKKIEDEFTGVDYVAAGAGREPGQLVQTIWKDLAGSSFLPSAEADKLESGVQRMTPIVTIDGLLAQRPGFRPDLVKLDIQGFELEALRGAVGLFGIAEMIILETSLYNFLPNCPDMVDCIQFMAERDYVPYDFVGYLRRDSDGAVGQVDVAFVKRQGRLRSHHDW